jgi:hypothetical protein
MSCAQRNGRTSTDHHGEYLATATAALTPRGRQRVDELLDELVEAGANHGSVVRFARLRETEAHAGQSDAGSGSEPGDGLSPEELDVLTVGFTTIRDQEPLDDVANWANAVLLLLRDERERPRE